MVSDEPIYYQYYQYFLVQLEGAVLESKTFRTVLFFLLDLYIIYIYDKYP